MDKPSSKKQPHTKRDLASILKKVSDSLSQPSGTSTGPVVLYPLREEHWAPPRTLGHAFSPDLIHTEKVDLKGQIVKSAEDLAKENKPML